MKFIVFEGLDGAGKSTLMRGLSHFLTHERINYIHTREPGGTPLSEEIRDIILRVDPKTAPVPRAELLLYEASRAQHVEQLIKPALKNGTWVLCDRFSASSTVFQGVARNLGINTVEWLNDFATESLKPDLTVLLDLSVEESLKRKQAKAQHNGETLDRMEQESADFHTKVREGFLKLASEQPNWLVLDAAKDSLKLVSELTSHIRALDWCRQK